jgi:hypothetical protein
MNLKESLLNALPSYNCTLPYSKIKTKFRPFLVKEEKKFLILEETSSQKEIYQGIIDILKNCFDENIDFDKIPLFELEYCFLKLRAKSVGEIITPKIICPETKESHIVEVNLDSVALNVEPSDSLIRINKNLNIFLKYPTIEEFVDSSSDINELVANCIVYFEDQNDRVYASSFKKEEILDFLNHLTISQYKNIVNFFEKMPSIHFDVHYKTTDGVQRKLAIRGLKNFFS